MQGRGLAAPWPIEAAIRSRAAAAIVAERS